MTTTDVLQVQHRYCDVDVEMPSYKKPTTMCKSKDLLGHTFPVFNDRLCDGHKDCPNGEDEGTIVPCEMEGNPTSLGCCEQIVMGGVICRARGTFSGRDAYTCADSADHIIFFAKQHGIWYSSTSGLPTTTWMYDTMSITDSVCPPTGDWEYGVSVYCKSKPVLVDNCKDHDCHATQQCINASDGYKCQCLPGFKLIDGNCVEIELVNECNNGAHNCHVNATCTDTVESFSCTCYDGYVGIGTSCELKPKCCKVIEMSSMYNNVGVCTFDSWVNGAMGYNCVEEQKGSYEWDFPMSLMFFPHKTNWYLLKETLEFNVNANYINWYDVQNVNTAEKCPTISESGESNNGWYHDYTYKCREDYRAGKFNSIFTISSFGSLPFL